MFSELGRYDFALSVAVVEPVFEGDESGDVGKSFEAILEACEIFIILGDLALLNENDEGAAGFFFGRREFERSEFTGVREFGSVKCRRIREALPLE